MRKGAELAQTLPAEWLERLDATLFSSGGDLKQVEDPVLLAASRRANRAGLLHWANSNLLNPCEPVEPYISTDMIETARELTRRGMPELLMNSARSTQNVSWDIWMSAAFQLTQDPRLLEEFLAVSSRSISEFFEGNMRVLTQLVQEEKIVIAHHDHIGKRYLVNQLLDAKETDSEKASRHLGYSIAQMHKASLIWSVAPDAEIQPLEEMAWGLARAGGTSTPLIVLAGPATLWVWFGTDGPLDLISVQKLAQRFPDVRVALGSPGKGLNGFRRSHLEALTTQRLMSRLAGATTIVSIDQVRMISLMTQDSRASQRFILSTLGRLATESAVLQRSLHAFLSQGCNLTRTAQVLGLHRNTLLHRLERAEDLLPVKLAEYRIQVGAALELLLWSTPPEEEL
jgi:DNA-binding PucR family transcriptional regulator